MDFLQDYPVKHHQLRMTLSASSSLSSSNLQRLVGGQDGTLIFQNSTRQHPTTLASSQLSWQLRTPFYVGKQTARDINIRQGNSTLTSWRLRHELLKSKNFDECTMMAIALLNFFQNIMEDSYEGLGTHMRGLRAILEHLHQQEGERLRGKGSYSPKGQSKCCAVFEFMPQVSVLSNALRLREELPVTTLEWAATLNPKFGGAASCKTLLQFAQISAEANKSCQALQKRILEYDSDLEDNVKEVIELIYATKAINRDGPSWNTGCDNEERWVV